MKYVLDSSVAVKWEVAEVDSDKADRLREDFRQATHELIAPDVFPVEVGHALTRAERQSRISVADGWRLWLSIMADAPTLHSYLSLRAFGKKGSGTVAGTAQRVLRTTVPDPFFPNALMPRAYALSSSAQIGVYDCLYVALAEREQCELITADDRLVRSLQPLFPFVVALASL